MTHWERPHIAFLPTTKQHRPARLNEIDGADPARLQDSRGDAEVKARMAAILCSALDLYCGIVTRPTITSRGFLAIEYSTPGSCGSQQNAWPSDGNGIVAIQRRTEPACGNVTT